MDFSRELNSPQLTAANSHNGPLMILAGAGTGKTRVITFRIASMLAAGIPPSRIVALTFTNKAAREMKERVKHLVGSSAKGLFIGTFHSFCISLLRKYGELVGVPKNFKLIGTAEQIDLIRRSIDELDWRLLYKPELILTRISHAKNSLLSALDLLNGKSNPYFHDEDPATLGRIYEQYERHLRLNRVIDFDDCILKTVQLLIQHQAVLAEIQQHLTHFLVDEFQDTNFAQLAVIENLAKASQNVCVVGDDDQSIYSWRGALAETLERFEEVFAKTKIVKLEQNYRCSNVILNAANTVIKNNSGRKAKTLWSKSEIEHPIQITSHPDDMEEARWIAKKIFGLLGQGYKPKDVGILYRANAQARSIEVALREFNIRYRLFGGSSFFERKEVKDFLAYFSLIINAEDRLSFWRIINTPARGVGLKSQEKIEELSLEHQITPLEVIKRRLFQANSATQIELDDFAQKISSLSITPQMEITALEQLGKNIIKLFRLEDDIKLKTNHEGARQRKIESLRRLPVWLKDIGEKYFSDQGRVDLPSLIDHLTLGEDSQDDAEFKDGNYVSLMTIHAAKGLEFPLVFVTGMEDDQLPHKNSIESTQGLAEERRLFYVAITRAKEQLFLSYAKERFSGFQKSDKRPSRFLKELPEIGVVADQAFDSFAGVTLDDRKNKNIARLASLKDRLKTGFEIKR